MKKFWIAAVFFIFLAVGVWGVTYEWNGESLLDQNDWEDPDNWVDNNPLPLTSTLADILIINTLGSDPTTNPPVSITVGTLTMTNGTFTLPATAAITTINLNGGALDIDAAARTTSNLIVTGSSSTISGTGTLTVTTLIDLSGGTFSGTAVRFWGATVNAASDPVTVNGVNANGATGTLDAGTKSVAISTDAAGSTVTIGTVNTTGNIDLTLNGTRTFYSGGINYNDTTIAGSITLGAALNTATLTNNGTLNLDIYTLTVTGNLTNSGTLSGTGSMSVSGGLSNTGTGTISNVSAIALGGNLSNAGIFTSVGTLALNGSGPQNINAGGRSVSALTVNKTGTATLTGALTVSGAVTLTAGTLNGGSGITLNVGGGWSGSGTFAGSTGTVEFTGNGTLTLTPTNSAFYNLTKSGAGTTTTVSGTPLNVSEALNISAGTLILGANTLNTKNITITETLNATTSTINLSGGTWNRTGTFTATGSTVNFTTATVNSANTFNVVTCTGAVNFSGANTFASLTGNNAALTFAAGSTQTISSLTTSGTSSLARSGATGRWNIATLTAVNFTITSGTTTISDCDSANYLGRKTSGGPPTQASNGGNNIRVFAGGDFYWIGSTVNNNWKNNVNWSNTDGGSTYYYPDESDATTDIHIPFRSNQLILEVDVSCGTMEITGSATTILDLRSFNLTVAGALTNGGTIRLQGGQTVSVGSYPLGYPGGTIQYQGGGAWSFGNTYTNLIIDSGITMGTAATLTVNGTAAINSNITTSGDQIYNNSVTLGGSGATRTLTSNGGVVTVVGAVTTTGTVTTLNVSAGQAITMDNTGNNVATVALTKTTATGNVSYKSGRGAGNTLTITASASAGGNIAIEETTGNLTVGSAGITGTGTITLSAAGTVGQSVGTITGNTLNVTTGTSISLNLNNNAASVSLNKTAAAAGAFTYNSSRGTGVQVAANNANGTVSVTEAAGGITVTTVNGINGITTSANNGNITLTANNTTNGNIAVNQAISAGTGTIALNAGTNITQNTVGAGAIAANILNAVTGQAITMDNTGNNVATVALTKTTATGNVSYKSGRGSGNTLTITANASAGGNIAIEETTGNLTVGSSGITGTGTITLSAAGTVGQSVGTITGNTLNVTTGTSISLNLNNNAALVSLNKTAAVAGNFTYNNSRTAGVQVAATNTNGAVFVTENTGGITVTTVNGINGIITSAYNRDITLTANNTANGNIAVNQAINAGTGTVTIESGGTTTVSGSIRAGTAAIESGNTITISSNITAGTVTLETNNTTAAASNNITITASVTGINSNLTIISGAPNGTPGGAADRCGTVTVNSSVTVSVAGPGPSNKTIHIEAATLNNTGTINATSGDIELRLDNLANTGYGTITAGGIVDIAPRHGAINLIYFSGTWDTSTHLTSSPYIAVPVSGTAANRYFSGFNNAYLVNVSDSENRTVTLIVNGFIEFYNSYIYSGTNTSHLSLTAAGGIRSYHSSSGSTNVQLNDSPFNIGAQSLMIDQGSLSVKASVITLNGGVVRGTTGPYNLTLESVNSTAVQQNISAAALGASGQALGDIRLANADSVLITGAVYANSFTQAAGTGTTTFSGAQAYSGVNNTASPGPYAFEFTGTNLTTLAITAAAANGHIRINSAATVQFGGNIQAASFTQLNSPAASVSTSFSGTQNYTGNFAFTGAALNINNTLNAGGTTTVTNSGDFITSAAAPLGVINTAGAFLQNGTGPNEIGANITASRIEFSVQGASSLSLSEDCEFTTTGNGNIVLNGTTTGSVAVSTPATTARNLTLSADGTGNITLGRTATAQTTINLAAGTLTVTAANVTTAAAVPLNIGTSTAATNLTINASTNFKPLNTLTVWGTTINSGTINAAAPGSGSNSILFNGSFEGDAGTIEGSGAPSLTPAYNIVFNGDNAKVGNFINNNNKLVLKGQYAAAARQTFSHTGTALGYVKIENRSAALRNSVELASGVFQAVGETLEFAFVTSTTVPGPQLYTYNPSSPYNPGINSFSWNIGSGSPPSSFTGFVNYEGKLYLDSGSEIHTGDFFVPDPSVAPYSISFRGPASIRVSGHVTIGDNVKSGPPGSGDGFEIEMADGELNIFTLVFEGKTGASAPQKLSVGGGAHIGSLRLTGANTYAEITNHIEIQGDVLIEPLTTLRVEQRLSDPIRIHITGYKFLADQGDKDKRGAKWYQTADFDTIAGSSGTFVQSNSIVEFGSQMDLPAGDVGRTFKITGNTSWNIFICYEPLADMLFSNYPHGHTFNTGIRIEPKMEDGSLDRLPEHMIKLSRLDEAKLHTYSPDPLHPLAPVPPDNVPYPHGSEPYFPPNDVNDCFWYFILPPTSELDLDYVYLYYCWSKNRIPQPSVSSEMLVIAIEYVFLSGSGGPELIPDYTLGDPRTQSIIPGTPNNAHQHSYYNRNWFVADYFFYSYTEDSDANGRIDRIRVQAGFELNGDFSGFEVEVPGFRVNKAKGNNGFNLVNSSTDSDSIFIYLKENTEPDTGKTLRWWITENSSLMDSATRSVLMNNRMDEPEYITDDMSPPRINYALAMPNHNELFFQMSEPLNSGYSLGLPGGGNPEDLGRGEFLVRGITPYTLDQLAAGNQYFDLDDVRDSAPFVKDLRSQPVDPEDSRTFYVYQYPSPKYPVDWDYSAYREIRGWYDPDNSKNNKSFLPVSNRPDELPLIREWYYDVLDPILPSPLPAPPSHAKKDFKTGNKLYGKTNGIASAAPLADQYGKGKHRVTDILVSVPPGDLTDAEQQKRFFVWPLWARYHDRSDLDAGLLGTSEYPGYGYLGQGSSPFTDSDIIWDFTGKRFLEKEKIVIQSRLSNNLAVSGISLVYALGVSDRYKVSPPPAPVYSSPGLWHPWLFTAPVFPLPDVPPLTPMGPHIFFGMVPEFLPDASCAAKPMTDEGSRLYNHTFDDSVFSGNTNVEFYFRVGADPNLPLAGRLDVPPGTDPALVAEWYRKVKPFSFGIHSVSRQRSGVTILNNVINSEKKENVFLDYQLRKPGRVTIQVFSLDGNLIKVLENKTQPASDRYYRVSWNGTNNAGRPVARGMYFIRIVGPDIDEIRKVMVVK